jgi:hypothetical protein
MTQLPNGAFRHNFPVNQLYADPNEIWMHMASAYLNNPESKLQTTLCREDFETNLPGPEDWEEEQMKKELQSLQNLTV